MGIVCCLRFYVFVCNGSSSLPVARIDPRGLLALVIDVVYFAIEIGCHIPAIGQRYLIADDAAIDVRCFTVAGRHYERHARVS